MIKNTLIRLLDIIRLFLSILQRGSFTAAGREMGLSPTTLSERLAALEVHCAVTLLNRTTRAISLTEEERSLSEAGPALLDDLAELDGRIRTRAHTLSGPIRVSAPGDLGSNLVSRAIDAFLDAHPNTKIELMLHDGYVDIVGDGIDIPLRFGEITDSTLRILSLGRARRVLCAAPSYFKPSGLTASLANLVRHACIVMRFGTKLNNVWRFGIGRTPQIVTVRGDRVTNDDALARQWGLEGHSINLKSELDVGSDLRAGRLVELLPDLVPPSAPLQFLFPPGRSQPRRTGAFADHLGMIVRQSLPG